MRGYISNIEQDTLNNNNFRQVVYTSTHSQLVLMNLKPGEDIGLEVHDLDQFFRIEAGAGKVILNDDEVMVEDGSAVVVPAGTKHNVVNTSETEDLKLYTIYSPPEHKDGVVHQTKPEAESDDEHFDGVTSVKE